MEVFCAGAAKRVNPGLFHNPHLFVSTRANGCIHSSITVNGHPGQSRVPASSDGAEGQAVAGLPRSTVALSRHRGGASRSCPPWCGSCASAAMKEPINPNAAQPSSRCRVHHRRTVLPRATPGMVWPKSRESEADIGSAKGRSANARRERAPPDRAHASWVANATDARAPAARGPNSAESVSPARELTSSGRGVFLSR